MRVSHETIYRSIYVQGKGALRRELAACLRTGRGVRVSRGKTQNRTKGAAFVTEEVMISNRPAEVEDRAVPGHWEGDLIVGSNSTAIGTLVERTTRFVCLLHLPVGVCGDAPSGHGATAVRGAIQKAMGGMPTGLVKSLTWDQGSEMAQHAKLTIDADLPVYFCDPHSPWQRGTNENTNGLLRQYFPKGEDLSDYEPFELSAVANALNSRPRKTLDWRTPAEALNTLLMEAERSLIA